MSRRTVPLVTIALLCLAVAPAGDAVAQQKQQVTFKATAQTSKYTQQQTVDVEDVPNHVVRVYEIHYTYPNNPPVINGLKLVESWVRGISDLTDGNGGGTIYQVYVMENGDKFFARTAFVSQSGPEKNTATVVGNITGGTGRLAGIQGIVRVVAGFNFKTGFNETQGDIEYSIGK